MNAPAKKQEAPALTHFRCAAYGLLSVELCRKNRKGWKGAQVSGPGRTGSKSRIDLPFACQDCAQAPAVEDGTEPTLMTIAQALAGKPLPEPPDGRAPPAPAGGRDIIAEADARWAKGKRLEVKGGYTGPTAAAAPTTPDTEEPMTTQRDRAAEILASLGEVTPQQIADELDTTRGNANQILLWLKNAGRAENPRRGIYRKPGPAQPREEPPPPATGQDSEPRGQVVKQIRRSPEFDDSALALVHDDAGDVLAALRNAEITMAERALIEHIRNGEDGTAKALLAHLEARRGACPERTRRSPAASPEHPDKETP